MNYLPGEYLFDMNVARAGVNAQQGSAAAHGSNNRFVFLLHFALNRHADRVIDYYISGTGSGFEVERGIGRQTQVDVAGPGVNFPVIFLYPLDSEITASRLRPQGAIDASNFDVARSSVDINVSSPSLLDADIAATGLRSECCGNVTLYVAGTGMQLDGTFKIAELNIARAALQF
jgi:hypothetical protein